MSVNDKETKLKIVYKKPTCYDDNETSSTNSSENKNLNNSLDSSVISSDTNDYEDKYNNHENINQNDILRNNILKEITGKTNNFENSELIEDNLNKDDTIGTYLVKKFIKYLKNNNISFEELNDNIFFNKIIKKYIIENNIEQSNILKFLEELNFKINSQKSNPNLLYNNFDKTDKTDKTIGVYKNSSETLIENQLLENFQNNSFSVDDESVIKEKNIIELLTKNDINTWLFMGVILISLIIIIMVAIYKK